MVLAISSLIGTLSDKADIALFKVEYLFVE